MKEYFSDKRLEEILQQSLGERDHIRSSLVYAVQDLRRELKGLEAKVNAVIEPTDITLTFSGDPPDPKVLEELWKWMDSNMF